MDKDFTWREELIALAGSRVLCDEPMSRHTTFRIGGNADAFWTPADESELIAGLKLLKTAGVPATILGNGSNVLVRDKGIRGCVVSLAAPMSDINIEGTEVTAGAGAILGVVANKAAEAGLTGLEFAVGIPGSIGGAVYMNAGAYGGEIKDIVSSVTALLPNGEVKQFTAAEFDFGYRHSVFQENGAIIISAVFSLAAGDKEASRRQMNEIQAKRREKQPLELPSAGSTFKRPPGYFAGTLIDQTGLKGYTVGGAQVSEKHAGFVVNKGGATAADVLQLMKDVSDRIYAAHGVRLEPEVKIIGEE
ncbi:MAG: UDP-N-acetylmuramate dehydrogenase [Selenomonadaceae bacterium]|nr:UDP-N-acetylmuramate dehydrogenase [Selenomonadaceae bacterium]